MTSDVARRPEQVLSTQARAVLAVIWVALMVEAFTLAPAGRPDQSAWLVRLVSGDWVGEEVLVVALFNLMGIWPFALAALLSDRLRGWPPLWPFSVASMALGGFILLPGLVLFGDRGPSSGWQRALAHPVWRAFLGLGAVGLLGWGVASGDVSRFAEIWRTELFVHVMALDFVALWLTSVVMARENGERWPLALLPVVGALAVADWPGREEG